MPRTFRKFSRTGIMHVIVRGTGKQIIFEAREDFIFFLKALEKYCGQTQISVWAYCLMDNHVHLLIYDKNQQMPNLMRKLGVCYSKYFNNKYERTGHLFQGRYLSEAVEDERYLRVVFRYILMNPEKAGICPAYEYEWSSIRQYGDDKAFADTSTMQDLFGNYEQYMAFMGVETDDACMELEPICRDDAWAKTVIVRYLSGQSPKTLQQYDRKKRDAVLRQLKAEGLAVKQLERLTGINRGAIQRA